MHIRSLGPDDAAAFQALRLRALRESPEAFGSTHEEEADTPLPTIADRLGADARDGNSFVLAAVLDDALVGLAACFRNTRLKERHRASIGGMYVAPEARGRGLGARLLDAVVARARQWPGLEQLTLTVVPESAAARRLYLRQGFQPFGRAPRAFRQGERYFDEEYLWRPLDPAR